MVTDYRYRNNKYGSSNYIEVLEKIIPEFYIDKEISVYGEELDSLDEILNSHVNLIDKSPSIFYLSANNENTKEKFRNIDQPSSFAKFFIKQNNLTDFNEHDFETKILNPLGRTLEEFSTSAAFKNYLASGLLSSILLNGNDNWEDTSGAFGANTSATNDYLLDNLGLFYIMNQAKTAGLIYQPSSYVVERLVDTIYPGGTLKTVDGVQGLTKVAYYNHDVSNIFSGTIPAKYVSGTGLHTSGAQLYESLSSLVEVIYSDKHIDNSDTRVKTFLEDYYLGAGVNTSAGIPLKHNLNSKGPLYKFLKATSFQFADLMDRVESLNDVYDIANCRDEHLPLIADLLGWEFFGHDPAKQRSQLRAVLEIYKQKGTKRGVQSVVNSIFNTKDFDVSSNIRECHETYLPHVILYALATETDLFKSLGETWTDHIATELGIQAFTPSSLDDNIRTVTDYVLLELATRHPKQFKIGYGEPYPIYRFEKKSLEIPSTNQLFRLQDPLFPLGETETFYSLIHPGFTKQFAFYAQTPETSALFYDWGRTYGHSNLVFAPEVGPLGHGYYLSNEIDMDSSDPEQNENIRFLTVKGSPNFVFNYRNHNKGFPLPPFELLNWYKNNTADPQLLADLVTILKRIGVREEFVDAIDSFFTRHPSGDTPEAALGGWLLFTSAQVFPDNFEKLLTNPGSEAAEYLPIWNSKSSHFVVDMAASAFDFTSTEFLPGAKYAADIVGGVAKEYSPAKAIALPFLTEDPFQEDLHPLDMASPGVDTEFEEDNTTSGIMSNFGAGYKGSQSTKMAKYYFRDGFAGPYHFSGEGPAHTLDGPYLGYIPSADAFTSIAASSNATLPLIYREHVGYLDSPYTFYGYNVSNTWPSRGVSALGSNLKYPTGPDGLGAESRHDQYPDRMQLSQSHSIMHRIDELRRLLKGRQLAKEDLGPFVYAQRSKFEDLDRSYANQLYSEQVDFTRFEFGENLTKLYNEYIGEFETHDTPQNLLTQALGFNLFSHAFGPLVYNADLEIDGSAMSVDASAYLQASSLKNIFKIDHGWDGHNNTVPSGYFSQAGLNSSGTMLRTEADTFHLPVPLFGTLETGSVKEFYHPGILSGVDLVGTSGASVHNNFQIYDLDKNKIGKYTDNPIAGKTVIKMKAINGLPRVRFDLEVDPEHDATRSSNRFLPEHEFDFSLSALIGNEDGISFGGGSIGVWIHTQPDANGKFGTWGYNALQGRNMWTVHDRKDLSRDKVINNFCIRIDQPSYATANSEFVFKTSNLHALTPGGVNDNPEALEIIENSNFSKIDFRFHTINDYGEHPPGGVQLHRKDQKYVVEIFLIPSELNKDKYLLLHSFSITDKTLNRLASVSHPEYPDVGDLILTPQETIKVIRHFKKVADTIFGRSSGGGSFYNSNIRRETITPVAKGSPWLAAITCVD